MGSGSGTLSAMVLASAGSLAFERVGGIVRDCVRPAVASLFVVFGKSNEGVHLSAASRLQVTPSVGLSWLRSSDSW
jgi:hypothetical protein